jgi:hypothetical protein
VPLYVHACTTLPGSTSQSTISAVMSYCLVPSASTVGSSSCPPNGPLASSTKRIARSVIAASMPALSPCPWKWSTSSPPAADGTLTSGSAPDFTCSSAVMPACACPAISHSIG